MIKDADGNAIVVGQFIGFKDDVEMYGKVTKVTATWIYIESSDPRTGEPTSHIAAPNRCWQD